MKAIVLPAVLNGFRSRKDKSIGFSVSSPELTTVEKVALMDLEGLNVRLLIEPTDYSTDGKVEVKGVLDAKPPSVRLRAVLFVLWKQLTDKKKTELAFNQFYISHMDCLINNFKDQLEPEQ